MQPKLSVVVPVYNGAAHLDRCIDSITRQIGFDADDIELVIIDDGSTDASPGIIARYTELFRGRLVSIRQANRGAAEARNRGLAVARGKYVTFVDQDDWVDATYCRQLYEAAIASGADVVQCGYRRPTATDATARDVLPAPTVYGRYAANAAWAKLYRTEFLRTHDVSFWNHPIGEDTLFTIRLLGHNPVWEMVRDCGYNWYLNQQSTSQSVQFVLTPDMQDALDMLVAQVSQEGDGSHEQQYFVVRMIVFYLLRGGRSVSLTELEALTRRLFGRVESSYPEIISWRRVYHAPRGERASVRLLVGVTAAMYRLGLVRLIAWSYRRLPASN